MVPYPVRWRKPAIRCLYAARFAGCARSSWWAWRRDRSDAGLVLVQAPVAAGGGDQLVVAAALDDAAAFHHQDLVGTADGAQAVRITSVVRPFMSWARLSWMNASLSLSRLEVTSSRISTRGSARGAHVRRMRNRYAQRQALLFALAGKHLPGLVELAPTAAGMQVAAWLARRADDCAVAEAGRRADLALRPLSPYWIGPGARPGLHLGYAAVSEEAMEPAVLRLAHLLADHPGATRATLPAAVASAPRGNAGDS